jgi:hypothetical protein
MSSWWTRNVVEPGKLPLLICFLAFVVTFLVTRFITRSIRAGRGPLHDVESGGMHIHHAVPGLVLLLVGAVTAIGAPPVAPWREVAALAIGAGSSLVLDEFALILHLQDVYWSDEGRASVQAVALVVACQAFALVGLAPFGVDDVGDAELGLRLGAVVATGLVIVSVAVCAIKGKYRLALVAVFIPVVALVGAVRLARPGSLWDRRRYRFRPQQRERAHVRMARSDARWDPRLREVGDLVAGRPSSSDQAGASPVSDPGVDPLRGGRPADP